MLSGAAHDLAGGRFSVASSGPNEKSTPDFRIERRSF
jgi:hypothetical protein